MSQQSQMALDLAALFAAEMTNSAVVSSVTYTVLIDDLYATEIDQLGGPDEINRRRVHFLASQLNFLEPGSIMYLSEPDGVGGTAQNKKIVESCLVSGDGSEMIATVRGA